MVLLIGSVWMAGRTGATRWDLSNPGALFVFVTGWLSVGGVYLTLQQVSDLRNSIVSFEDFVVRVTALIDETGPDDMVKMLVLTPAMGCLTLDRSRWHKLTNKIQGTETNIQLTALNFDTMDKWFHQYLSSTIEKDKDGMRERIADGLDAAKTIIGDLARKAKPQITPTITNSVPVQGNWEDIPKTYLVCNSTKAIVCAPLFLPTPDSNPLTETNLVNRVQMIGFESQDFHIIESARLEIDLRREAITKAAKGAQDARDVEEARAAAEAKAAAEAEGQPESPKVVDIGQGRPGSKP